MHALDCKKGGLSMDGLLHKEASLFLKHMATALYRACFCMGSSSEPLSERVTHQMEKWAWT